MHTQACWVFIYICNGLYHDRHLDILWKFIRSTNLDVLGYFIFFIQNNLLRSPLIILFCSLYFIIKFLCQECFILFQLHLTSSQHVNQSSLLLESSTNSEFEIPVASGVFYSSLSFYWLQLILCNYQSQKYKKVGNYQSATHNYRTTILFIGFHFSFIDSQLNHTYILLKPHLS